MTQPQTYSFPRYLAAKISVDERALNPHVRQALAEALHTSPAKTPLEVLEIGAGTGAMVERSLDWGLLCAANYTAMDISAENLAEARRRLPEWAERRGYRLLEQPDGALQIAGQRQDLRLRLEQIDLFDFIRRETGRRCWDLLMAHAFLDLIDIPAALPRLFRLIRPGGLFYFTINFDGETIFEPEIDPEFDAQVMSLYHRTMDDRVTDGRPSGDSRSGRHLFRHLAAAGAEILAAGASDWVVYPRAGKYPHDEAYFMHFMIDTLHTALAEHPELDAERFERWIAARHAQVERGELIYIAHQLDFAGRTAIRPV